MQMLDGTYLGHPLLDGLDDQMRSAVANAYAQRLPDLIDILSNMDEVENGATANNDNAAATSTGLHTSMTQVQQQMHAFYEAINASFAAGPFAPPPPGAPHGAEQEDTGGTHDAEPSPGKA